MSSCAGLPVREIGRQEDLDQFLGSETCENFYQFICQLSESVQGLSFHDCPIRESTNVKWATALIDGLSESVQSYPLEETNSRFGNPAFRGWLDSVRQIVPKAHHDILQGARVADEVASYLLNSLGDYQRIDYGTGHEAHFMAWLYCLCRPETGPFFSPTMRPALVLDIFRAYLRLMRRLQMTFWLEPAGSHGVWGLDDYHFLPFLFGAAQLIGSLSPLDPLTSG